MMGSSAASTGATARLARFVCATSYDDLRREIPSAVQWALLDTIGVTAVGVRTPAAEAIASMAEAYAGPTRATLIGRRLRCDPAWAALVNGTTGHALDYDDQSWSMGGHPSMVLWPAILGLAEAYGGSGRDLIRAYAVGFEAAGVVGSTVNPDHYGHGWHTTATVGAVAAACAGAAVLGLDERRTAHAIAIGASHAAGLRQQFGTSAKPLHVGNAARAGVVAAELAARGFEGSPEILEGRWGFFNVFRPGDSAAPPDLRPGDPWRLLDPGIATKVFPSCGATHPGIGAMLELRERGLRADDVRRVEVRVVDMTARILEHPRPRDGLEAKFSMEYCLARALVSGSVELDHFDDAAVRSDAAVGRLVERTRMEIDPVLTERWVWGTPRATELAVELESGETMRARADLPPGSPGNFPRELLDRKLADCLRRTPLAGSAEEITAGVERLERLTDIRELTTLLGLAAE